MKILLKLLSIAVLASVSAAQKPMEPTVITNGMGPVVFLRFSPDGRELIRICQFGPVEMFDTSGYKSARTFDVGMRMIAYSADGTRLATAEGSDGARVWDAKVPGVPITDLPPTVAGKRFRLSSPLHILQAPSEDRTVRVFWTEFSPDGKQLITTHANGHVKVWNTVSGAVEDDINVTSAEALVAKFTPDGKTIVIGDTDGVLHFWSRDKKSETNRTETPLGGVVGIVFAPRGDTFVTLHASSEGSAVMIWGMPPGLAEDWKGYDSAAFSKDGKLLVLGGERIELGKVDSASWKRIRSIEVPTARVGVSALAFSPDNTAIAVGYADGTVRLVPLSVDGAG